MLLIILEDTFGIPLIEFMSKIGRFIFIIIPYIEVYNEFMTKYYYNNGKVVRADLVSLYERLKRTARP